MGNYPLDYYNTHLSYIYRLITLYNLQAEIEDDCIHQTIKDNSISKLRYFGPDHRFVSALTHIETLSLWSFEDVLILIHFNNLFLW